MHLQSRNNRQLARLKRDHPKWCTIFYVELNRRKSLLRLKSLSMPPAIYPVLKVGIPLFALVLVCLALVRGTGRDHEVPTLKASSIGMVPSISDDDETPEPASDDASIQPNRPFRWKFAEKKFADEYNGKMGRMARADVFAEAFERDAVALAKALDESKTSFIVDWVGKYLPPINSNLRWEAGPGPQPNTYEFTVTCEQHRELQQIVDAIIRKTKRKNIKNWQFFGFRRAMPPNLVEKAFVARGGGKVPSFKVEVKTDIDKSIALTFISKDFSGDNIRKDLGSASLLIELILGEDNLNHWVGSVATKKAKGNPKAGSVVGDATAFRRAFDKEKNAVVSRLPAKLYWELKPPEQQALVRFAPRGVGAERKTLITWLPGFERAAGSNLFSYQRFSKNREVFCYLKARGVGELVLPEKREAIEKTIDQELRTAKVGCMVGAGSGTMESIYIDLCLPSIDNALPKLKELCATLKLPKSTRIRFYDPEWRYEWVGMFDETPPPSEPDSVW